MKQPKGTVPVKTQSQFKPRVEAMKPASGGGTGKATEIAKRRTLDLRDVRK